MAHSQRDDSSSPPQAPLASVVRIHYDNDLDDNDEHSGTRPEEERPLITQPPTTPELTTRSNLRSIGRPQEGSGHSLHTLQGPDPRGLLARDGATTTLSGGGGERSKVKRWGEWSRNNGLHPSTWTGQTYIKAALLATLVTLVVLAFTVLRVQDHIKDILHYIDDHRSVGAVLFVVFYTIACWLFLPGSLFTIGAGFLFKPMPFALAIVVLGDILGAIGSFLFGRYIFYDWVKDLMSKHPKFTALDEVIKDDGWKIVVMLRLTPIPFNLITYFFSITSISLSTLTWATAVGVFPGSCLGIWIGSLLKGLSGIDNPELEKKNMVILIMNGVFIVCSILTLSMFGKRSLRKALAKLDHHQRFHQDNQEPHEGDDDDEEEERHSHHPQVIDRIAERILERADADADEDEETTTSLTSTSQTVTAASSPLVSKRIPEALKETGFTRAEKWTFVGIAVVAVINICVCIPLYYRYANQDD
ncbi:MAG: snare associated Golgi protein-domain-containing protein [Linnemannia gamsii]|nr:MAG: snare associated Golgi protein-domain-containing protein [Linnemannia gamsii]